MEETSLCCGQIPKRKKIIEEKNLPKNPNINNGTEVIYLGAGDMKLKGKTSGLTYYVSDHRRRFTADTKDVPGILKMRNFILKP
jgi:hypothetical protein